MSCVDTKQKTGACQFFRYSSAGRLGAGVVAMMTCLMISATSASAWCGARHAYNGQIVQPRERPGPSMHWAHASYDPDGWPAITYGPTYYQLPPIMQIFTRLHECGHLAIPTTNELQANCYALRGRNWSQSELQFIANFHASVGPLPPQYGGSGAGFWTATLQNC